MTSKKRTMAIVGTGSIARVHAMACQGLPDVELVAACDVDVDRARAFAGRWGMERHMNDVADLIALRPDSVSICTPHPSHGELLRQIAGARIDCMVEKPLTVNLADARLALEAAEKAGARVGVIFQRRYWPAAQRLRKAIDEGRLGRIVQAECVVRYSRTLAYFSPDRSPWRGRWDSEGGGVTVNHASHALDMLQWFVGPFDSLYARWDNQTHPGVEVDTMVAGTAKLTNGGLASISFGLNPHQTEKGFFEVTVYGESGAWASVREEPEGAFGHNAQWEVPGEQDAMQELTARELAEDRRMYRIVDKGRKPPELSPDCYRAQYRDFFDHLDGKPGYGLTGREGLKTVEIIEAIYQSCRQDTPVHWPIAAAAEAPRGGAA